MTMTTTRLTPDPVGLDQAAAILQRGGLVAIPTETVYGLAADATHDTAVAEIFAAKGRPRFNPLIVHLPDSAAAQPLVHWSDLAETLARAFWPGALTLVLPLRDDHGLSPLVTSGLDSLAIRVPAHPVARSLLSRYGKPLAAPSANPSGRISPTTADHVLDGLGGRIDAVLDGGVCTVGVESTIVGLLERPTLLRPGGIAREAIEACIGQNLAGPDTPDTILAPGQMQSHYAPNAPVRLNAVAPQGDEVFLGFGPGPASLNLSETGDLTEAAAQLFSHLHQLNVTGRPIAVAPIPETGLGLAINDRLRRAAAPKPS